MKTTLLCLALLGSTLAVPNGYYHQEYNYKSSSSAYKNNELQHKSDDQGYYKKDGDLEGRMRPRVDSNSEHSEYVNPNLRNSQSGYNYGGSDLTSNGQMMAQNSYSALGANQLTEGLASSDHLLGYSSGSSYGSGNSYATSSNLRSILTQLQTNMEQDLRDSIHHNNYQTNTIERVENELRRNMTERLNAELMTRYGQQAIRGGQTYSIHNGRVGNVANYDNEELANLKLQMENNLLNQLRREYSQGYSTNTRYGTHSSSSSSRYQYHTSTTMSPLYHTLYPTLTTPRYDSNYYDTNNNRYTSHSDIRYAPISKPESITTIASRVQNKLDTRLNDILDEARTKYFSSSSAYTLTNTDVVLDRLRDELRGNLSYLLDEEIRRNYGNQEMRDGYYYSLGSNGQLSPQQNYAARDLENLKSQIERNLIEKLNRDFETYRSRWSQSQSWSSQSSYGSQSNYGSRSNYDANYPTPTQRYVYTTPRYLMNQNTYGGPSSNRYEYGYAGSSGNTGIKHGMSSGISSGLSNGISSGSIAQLQSKLQNDLSRQLQQALSQRSYGYGSSGAQSYETNLQQLRDEMNRNITRNIQEYSASGSYGAYGDFSESAMAALRHQLESNLMRQLQQGLQQSFQSHQSYSSSSSGSSAYNRPVRGFQNNQMGQYRSGIDSVQGEECLGDDPNMLHTHRVKRSYGYRSRPLGLGTTSYVGSSGSYGYRYPPTAASQYNQVGQLGQDIVEPVGQEEDDTDLTQQVEESGFEQLQVGNQYQVPIGQQQDNTDLTQVDDPGLGQLQVGNLKLKKHIGQHEEDDEFGSLQIGNQKPKHHITQQEGNPDSTQKLEDIRFGQLQVANHNQHPDDSDLTQIVQEPALVKLEIGNQYPPPTRRQVGVNQNQPSVGQQEANSELTQQVQEPTFGKLEIGNQHQQPTTWQAWTNQNQQPYVRLEDISDLTQVQEPTVGTLEIGNQHQQPTRTQQEYNIDSTEQVEETEFGSLHVGNTHKINAEGHSYLGYPNLVPVRPSSSPNTHVQQSATKHQYESSGLTQQVHYTGYGKPGKELTSQDLDVIVNTLEQNLSKELQKLVNAERDNGNPNIPEIVRVLQTKITIPGRLTQQQLAYVTSEIQTFIFTEIRKLFGDEYNYTIQFGTTTGTSSVPKVETNSYILEGFKTTKFSDFTSTQINTCESMESTLSLQLKLALSQIPSSLSNAELHIQHKRLREELLQNITRIISNLPPEESTLFTKLQLHRIKGQLEEDLKQQLDNDLYKTMTPYYVRQEKLDDEIDTDIGPKPKPPGAEIHMTELPRAKLGPKSWNVPGFTEKQTHFCQYLEDTFTKKLNEAIDTQHTFNYGPNKPQPQVFYQQLFKEIEKNITARIDSYSTHFLETYMTFSKQQVELVKSQLMFNLELKLRKQLALANNRDDINTVHVEPQPTKLKPYPTSPQQDHQPQVERGQQQEEIGQQQEEIGQQQEEIVQHRNEMGQKPVIDDSFEKLEPIIPLVQRPIQESNPRPMTIRTDIYSQLSKQPQMPDGLSRTISKPISTKPINSNQFLQTEIQELQVQGQFTQSTTTIPKTNQIQPDTGFQVGVTSQGQLITQEQTLNEAYNTSDALLDMLRKKQNSQDLKSVQVNANPAITPTYNGYNSPNPTYGGNDEGYQRSSRPSYGGSYPAYQPNNGPTYGGNAYQPNNRPTYGSNATSYGGNTPMYGGSYSPYRPNTGSPSSYDVPLSYGHQDALNTPREHTSDIELIPSLESSPMPHYNLGVKGRPRYTPQVYAQEESSSATPLETLNGTPIPDSDLPWWKRFGNKVKTGASKLKEKIVG